MKILHVFNEFKYSGAEIMYADAACSFQSFGCQLYALETSVKHGEFANEFIKKNIRINRIVINNKWNIIQVWKFANKLDDYIRQEEIDVVHIHRSNIFFIVSLLCWLKKKRCIYTVHNVFTSGYVSRYYHIILRKISIHLFKTKFHTISDSVYKNELNYYKIKTNKIYNWYSDKRFFPRTMDNYTQSREELNIPKTQYTIISIGGCSHIKQHHDIIEALHILKEKGITIYYLHLGEGNTLDDEIGLAKHYSLDNSIAFLGNHNNVKKYLDASDLYIMPSKFEGISLTTIEAMAVKIPTLLYDVPGLKDFNADKFVNTILINPDSNSLADAIISFLRNEFDVDSMTSNAFNHVTQRYNMAINTSLIYKLYTC